MGWIGSRFTHPTSSGLRQLKRASLDESGSKDYWQAGKSAGVIDSIRPAGDIVREFGAAIG